MTKNTFAQYLALPWSSKDDACECCGIVALSEGHYFEGLFGHYCSLGCLNDAENLDLSNEHEYAAWAEQLCSSCGRTTCCCEYFRS